VGVTPVHAVRVGLFQIGGIGVLGKGTLAQDGKR